MEYPQDSTPKSSLSSRASHIDTVLQGTPSHPMHIQPRRESRPLLDSRDVNHKQGSVDMEVEAVTDEQSPLLVPCTNETMDDPPLLDDVRSPDECGTRASSSWESDAGTMQESKSSCYMFLLTICLGGLQVAWSVELSNGSPYLLGLGISKSFLALVWIAGPLSGVLVQPYVGIRSDRCRSRFGRRRPFMVGGAIATIISMMILAWTREIMGGFLALFKVSRDSERTKTASIVLAALMIYILDFSINVVQAGIRAFIVDNSPTHQQDTANAWASRMSGIGNIIGYLFGYADLPKYMWLFGDTQFKVLCVIASILLTLTLAMTCLAIRESDQRSNRELEKPPGGVFLFFKTLFRSVARLPPQIKSVCIVQLAAWVGWFPFLFYITTYVGGLYVKPIFRGHPNMTDEEIDNAWQQGTQVGTFALLIYALVSFSASVVLPWFIASIRSPPALTRHTPLTPTSPIASRNLDRTSVPDADGRGFFDRLQGVTGARPFKSIRLCRDWFQKIKDNIPSPKIRWLTLKRAWLLSHLIFASLTWLTFAVYNTTGAIIITGLFGITWAMTMWAPFALIAADISRLNNIRAGLIRPPCTREGELLAREQDVSEGADQAGVVLGIHNVAIAAPQLVATLISSAIFRALQKPRDSTDDDSVAWVLRFGGLMALLAAWLTRRVTEEGDEEGTRPKW